MGPAGKDGTMAIRDEGLKELLEGYKKPEDLLGPEGLLKKLTAALMEKALTAEMTEHLGYEKHEPAGRGSGNSRNGTSDKTLKTESGEIPIEVPRDRNGTFEPQLVKKHQTHVDSFDEKIISMYARGITVREIQGHLRELCGVEVSPDLISRVTSAVIEEVKAWHSRPLEACYPIVYLDALVIKVRDQGTVTNKSRYLNRPGFSGGYRPWEDGAMKRRGRYPTEVRERAVRVVFEQQAAHGSQWAAISSIVSKMGCMAETLRKWVRQAERDSGARPGLTTSERERLKELERENRELPRVNEILLKASAFFAQAEVDRRAR